MAQARDGVGPVRVVTEQSTAELVQHASEQIARLIKDEFTLARIELAEKGRHAGMGAGLLGGGGLFAFYGVGVLIIAAVLGLAVVLPDWLAALIVGVALLLIAGILALTGRSQVKRAVPPMPEATAQSVREDLESVSTAMRHRGRP